MSTNSSDYMCECSRKPPPVTRNIRSSKMRTRKEGVLMEFHISRQIRKQIDFDDLLFSFSGNVIFGNVTASRKLAAKLQTVNSGGQPEKTISGPALFAMGLIDELSH